MDKIEPFSHTEKEKSGLVESLFDGLPEKSDYLIKLYNMLQVLDSGFMSDRKSEAQKAFREINDVSVIPEDKKEQFYDNLKSFDFSKNMLIQILKVKSIRSML